jgi:hypothetical protein
MRSEEGQGESSLDSTKLLNNFVQEERQSPTRDHGISSAYPPRRVPELLLSQAATLGGRGL